MHGISFGIDQNHVLNLFGEKFQKFEQNLQVDLTLRILNTIFRARQSSISGATALLPLLRA